MSSRWSHLTSLALGGFQLLLILINFILKPFVVLILRPVSILIVEEWVPRSVKELLYLASIYGVLNDINPFSDSCDVADINNTLDLVKNPNALRFPFFVAHFIWDKHHDEFNRIRVNLSSIKEDKEKLLATAESIVELSPHWILYDRRRNVVTALMEIITKSNAPRINLGLS